MHTAAIALGAARMLAGIGSANIATSQAYITDVTAPQNRAKALGMIGAAFGLGFIFGPPVGGFIKEQYGMDAVGYYRHVPELDQPDADPDLPPGIVEGKGSREQDGTETGRPIRSRPCATNDSVISSSPASSTSRRSA